MPAYRSAMLTAERPTPSTPPPRNGGQENARTCDTVLPIHEVDVDDEGLARDLGTWVRQGTLNLKGNKPGVA